MKPTKWLRGLRVCVALFVGLMLAGFARAADCPNGVDRVALQLKWILQPQFAGYLAADRKGFYEEECLEVDLRPGGVVLNVFEEVLTNRSQFAIAWLEDTIIARETRPGGDQLMLLSQIFQRAGHCKVQWKKSGLQTVQDLKDKTVCVWPGEETDLRKLCAKYNLTYDEASMRKGRLPPSAYFDAVPQSFTMAAFLRQECDSASAMSYNEVATIYEHNDPQTGRLYTKDDLNFIDFNAEGVGTMEDGIIASSAWLEQDGNAAIAVRFLRASFKGWMYARDFPDEVLSFFPFIGPHLIFQMHEVNKLLWPTPTGVGLTSDELLQSSANGVYRVGVVSSPVELSDFYRKDLAMAAHQGLGTTGFVWGPTQNGPGSADSAGKNWKGINVSFCQVGDSVLVCEMLKRKTYIGPWMNFSDPIIIVILVLLIVLVALALALVGTLIKHRRQAESQPQPVELVEDQSLER